MLPGNVDPRRPDKVQRYKPPTANGQGEDLTPDYMNILGQRATTANAPPTEPDKHLDVIINPNTLNDTNHHHLHEQPADLAPLDEISTSTNTTNVIPTSPQYGVAIISSNVSIGELPACETVTISTGDPVIDPAIKAPPPVVDDPKDLHSTPSRNDRFKVVKIASLEPFKRGRWKCMDYVDETPPPTLVQPAKVTQSNASLPGGVYLQTQSLPQQQIQQMLLQSGYTNGTQFFPANVPGMMPQTQYFYPPGANIQTQTLPQQLVNASGVPTSMPAQFMAGTQPYFTGVVQNSGFAIPAGNYQNLQYLPANLIQNQSSAFVPTSTVQLPANFQQSQTYAGQPTMVNGHAYSNEQPQHQQVPNTQPNQTAKSVILNTNIQPVQIPQTNLQSQTIPNNNQSQSVPVIQNQYQQTQNYQTVPPTPPTNQNNMQVFEPQPKQQQIATSTTSVVFEQSQPVQQQLQTNVEKQQQQQQASSVYTNPQFDINNVNSLTVLEQVEQVVENLTESGTEIQSENSEDPSKTNPVVNAIDNKIEQAMDLVKSHLMYTVREEVEVLKEKIAELMERIQQLETENNFLRAQIPKPVVPPVQQVAAPIVQSSTTSTPIIEPQ